MRRTACPHLSRPLLPCVLKSARFASGVRSQILAPCACCAFSNPRALRLPCVLKSSRLASAARSQILAPCVCRALSNPRACVCRAFSNPRALRLPCVLKFARPAPAVRSQILAPCVCRAFSNSHVLRLPCVLKSSAPPLSHGVPFPYSRRRRCDLFCPRFISARAKSARQPFHMPFQRAPSSLGSHLFCAVVSLRFSKFARFASAVRSQIHAFRLFRAFSMSAQFISTARGFVLDRKACTPRLFREAFLPALAKPFAFLPTREMFPPRLFYT